MEKTETQFYTYDHLPLHNGQSLGPVTLAYETFGKLNEAKDNAILVFHALSGSQHVLALTQKFQALEIDGTANAKSAGGTTLSVLEKPSIPTAFS